MLLKLVLCVGVCAMLQASGLALHNNDNLGIIGGKEVSIELAPYMAVLYESFDDHRFRPWCGGSIVHERFVLTAAHCVDNNFVTSRLVFVGSALLGDGVQIFVEKTLCYSGHLSNYTENDICLLKLRNPVPLGEKVALVQLPDKNSGVEYGSEVDVAGWGIISNDLDFIMTDKLRLAKISVVSKKECATTYRDLQDNMFCAGSTGRGTCLGDSGGPLTHNNVLIGLTKSGRRNYTQYLCGVYPGVFIRVALYVDWINNTISENL